MASMTDGEQVCNTPGASKAKSKIITIDGHSGVGKGTTARFVAKALGWDYLDSGAIYRLAALACMRNNVAVTQEQAIAELCFNLNIRFDLPDNGGEPEVYLNEQVVTQEIRTEQCGNVASKISALPAVRAALLQRQRDFLTEKGLVTDGRDMGTVVFPKAPLKYFLIADLSARASRRHGQLKKMEISVNIAQLAQELSERDERDQNRAISPMKPAPDAIILDTTALTVQQVCDGVLQQAKMVFA
jgi:CMP/dCMP kinase